MVFSRRGVTGRADTRRQGRLSLTAQVGWEVSQVPFLCTLSAGGGPQFPLTTWVLCSGVSTLDVVVAYPVLYPTSRDVTVRAEVERTTL